MQRSRITEAGSRHGIENKTEWSIARALKWSIFIAQRLTLHKNGVEFCQQFNGAIRTSLTALYDDVRRHLKFVTDIHTHTHTHRHRDKATHRARLPSLKRGVKLY